MYCNLGILTPNLSRTTFTKISNQDGVRKSRSTLLHSWVLTATEKCAPLIISCASLEAVLDVYIHHQ